MNESDADKMNLSATAATDPALDALLDEALAPDAPAADLNERVVAATSHRLPSSVADGFRFPRAGVERFGFAWRSTAAMLLFGLVLAGIWATQGDRQDAPAETGMDLVAVESALDRLAEVERSAADPAEAIDDRLDWLSMQVAWADDATEGVWAQGAIESLDTAIVRDQYETLSDELDLYF